MRDLDGAKHLSSWAGNHDITLWVIGDRLLLVSDEAVPEEDE
jgi:hypothetical protein